MALLKKLRNSTEFCSEDCRQKYQDESNQLAVSRLMQQRKPKPARAPLGAARPATGVLDRTPPAPAPVAAVVEPPIAEFLPQTAIAAIEIHPVAAKIDWQLRKSQQLLPALSEDVLPSLLALQFAQLEEQYAPRGPRPALIEGLFPLAAPALWLQVTERQALPTPSPNLTQNWTAVWPAAWREIIELVRENSAAAEPSPAVVPPAPEAPATEAAAQEVPVKPAAPAPLAPTPAAIPPLALSKPSVVSSEPAEPSPVVESVAMPQAAIQSPETAMLPLRPRIAFAPRQSEPAAVRPEKGPAVKPILVSKPAEAAKAAEPTKRSEAKTTEKSKPAETRIPDVRLESRRPEKSPEKSVVEEAKPAAKSAEPKPVEAKGKESKAAEPVAAAASAAPAANAPSFGAPTFGVPSKNSAATGLWHRMPWWERCAAVAVFLLSIGGWLINGRPAEDKRSSRSISLPSPAAPAPGMGSDSWASERATDLAGAALNRQLSLYRPSKTMKDYVVEFQGTIQERALGWIVRAKDASNYYCIKLEVDKAGTAKLVRFGVIGGKEDAHTQLPLSLLPKPENGAYKVRVEAKGPKISTYINGQAVDVWVDERLAQGAAGFTNERGERAVVKSVQVSF
jgi:hypothetical protein